MSPSRGFNSFTVSRVFGTVTAPHSSKPKGQRVLGRGLAGVLATVFMVLGVLLVWAWTGQDAAANDEVSGNKAVDYVEYEWDETTSELKPVEKQANNCTKIEDSTTSWGNEGTTSCYVVEDSSLEISDRVTVSGDVHLILVNEASLTVNGGIGVPAGASLTVYGQNTQNEATPGKLTATANGNYDAGIGGTSQFGDAGAITIHGGKVTAKGGSYAAGVGSSNYGDVELIAIYGGQVEATGGGSAAGIGGGYAGSVDSIVIYGGQVNATGASNAAGIGSGGGSSSSVESIAIYGGQVTAKGGASTGRAIGGENVGSLVISGGYFNLTSGSNSHAGALIPSATVSGGVFADRNGTAWDGELTSNGDSGSQGKVYGVVPVDGYYVVQNTDSKSREDYPYVVVQGVDQEAISIAVVDSKTYDGVPIDVTVTVSDLAGNSIDVTASDSLSLNCYALPGADSNNNPVGSGGDGSCTGLVDVGSYLVEAVLAAGLVSSDGQAVDEMGLDPRTGIFPGVLVLGEAEVSKQTSITQRVVAAVVAGDVGKTYDGTTAVLVEAGDEDGDSISSLEVSSTLVVSLSDVVDADKDDVRVDPESISYAYKSADAGTKAVKVTIGKLSGGKAGNYVLLNAGATIEHTVDTGITAKEVTAVVSGDASKIYDGTTDVVVEADDAFSELVVLLDGVLTGDVHLVQVDGDDVSYEYVSPDAGTKAVNVAIGKLSGGKAGNYTLANPTSTYDVESGIGQATPLVDMAGAVEVNMGAAPATVSAQASITGVDGSELPGTWSWTDQDGNPITAVTGEPGDVVAVTWTFTPEDANYVSASGTVTFTITGSITPGAGGDEPGTGTGNDPVIDTDDSGDAGNSDGGDVTGDDAAGGTGSADGGSSDDLAATGISANLFALLSLAVLAGLSGLTMAARKHS